MLFIIGNGKSRGNFDCNQLKNYGHVICCNEAFQEINHDAVAANHKHLHKLVYNFGRAIWVNNYDTTRDIYWGANQISQMPNHLIDNDANPRDWNSGQVGLIAGIIKYKPSKVYLLGFDFFDIPNPKKHWQEQDSNNMYHNMHNERPPGIEKIYNWITEEYPDIDYYRVGPLGDKVLDKLNMECITYAEFKEIL